MLQLKANLHEEKREAIFEKIEMPLRIRDSSTVVQRRRSISKLTESSGTTRKSDIERSVLDLRETQPQPFSSFSDNFFTSRGRYVLSVISESKVTFVNTKKLRFSAPRAFTIADVDRKAQRRPLDLTVKNRQKSRDSNSSSNKNRDSIFSNSSSSLVVVEEDTFPCDVSARSDTLLGNCRLLAFNKHSKTDSETTNQLPIKMLSSRRHHSDETFSDRERSTAIDGNSSYPHSADAWVGCRGSLNRDAISLSDIGDDETKDSIHSSSDVDCENKNRNNDQSLSDVGEEENGKIEDFQDAPFNYSTRNKEENCSEKVENLKKAKRLRVENIVTSIKVKPNRGPAEEFSGGNSLERENACIDKQFRKRKRGEQIRELKKQLETLQKESEMEEVYENYSDGCERDDELKRDWQPPQKRSRNDNDLESLASTTPSRNSNGFYRGLINFMVSQNGCRHSPSVDHITSDLAFEVLCRSIKQEIGSALNKIAESAAKKVLQEFGHGVNKIGSDSEEAENKPLNKDSSHKAIGLRRSDFGDENVIELIGAKKTVHSSRYVADDKSERHSTSNQSQMCFGDVRVRKNDVIRKQDHNEQARRSSHSASFENEVWVEAPPFSARSREDSPEITRSSPDSKEVQTKALSLVKEKSTSFYSHKSSSPLEEKGFAHRGEKDQSSSAATSPEDSGESFKYSQSSFSDSRSRSDKSLLDASLKDKFSQPTLLPESSFYSSSSSAFRLPFRNDPLPPQSFRRDSYPSPNMLKAPPFSFGPSLYPSGAGQSQSVFPFSTGQLSFPLFQSLHQRSLANVIADYGRLREGFEHGTSRPVSTRTSTRDPPRTPGVPRSISGHKSDSLDFRNIQNDVSPYSAASIQEGLTPQHLKKAKLMFFYTRYPSANTLKTYFSDVKFSRATTSQLIKWFSNFREFYYIQMEKFARQALSDGIVDINQLKVTRDCELFRVLNLHYNKSNDFRVPSEFLATTLRTLQEFFLAIQKGKDQDPAWKKVIYKIICKLDQDIPELFKLHNVLEHLDEIGA